METGNKFGVYCSTCNISVPRTRQGAHRQSISHIENELRSSHLKRDLSKNPYVSECQLSLPEFQLGQPSRIEQQVYSFMTQVHLLPEECRKKIEEVLRDLKRILVSTFGPCDIYYFGSMATGTAFKGSDVDIYIEIGDFKYNTASLNKAHIEESKVFKCTEALLHDPTFSNVTPIFQASVPIVKTVHVSTRTSCDISFKNPLGVEFSRLVQRYLALHPTILEVMLIIKYWAKKQNICNGKSSISSYAWTLLFIGYLQSRRTPFGDRFVPSFYEVSNKERSPNGVPTDFILDKNFFLPNDPMFTQVGLLKGFFNYYKNFDFEKNIVSPFLGEPIDTTAILQKEGPFDPKYEARRMCVDSCKGKVWPGHVNIIQDPFLHDFLLRCPRVSFHRVRLSLHKAAEKCETYVPNTLNTFLQDLFTLDKAAVAKPRVDTAMHRNEHNRTIRKTYRNAKKWRKRSKAKLNLVKQEFLKGGSSNVVKKEFPNNKSNLVKNDFSKGNIKPVKGEFLKVNLSLVKKEF